MSWSFLSTRVQSCLAPLRRFIIHSIRSASERSKAPSTALTAVTMRPSPKRSSFPPHRSWRRWRRCQGRSSWATVRSSCPGHSCRRWQGSQGQCWAIHQGLAAERWKLAGAKYQSMFHLGNWILVHITNTLLLGKWLIQRTSKTIFQHDRH